MHRLLFCCLFLAMTTAIAQPGDPLGGKDTIVIENERIGDIIDSDKPFLKPPYQQLEKGTNEDIRYESRSFYVETDFTPPPPEIRSVEAQDEPPVTNNLLRLGIGRYVTPLAQLYVNNGPEKDLDYGLQFTHRSAHQDEIPLRRFREDYGTFQLSKIDRYLTAQGRVHLYNTQYFNYAGDDSTRIPGDAATREDSLRMSFTRFDLGGRLFSNFDPDQQWSYDAGVNLRAYGDRRYNQEVHLDLTPSGAYHLNEDVQLGLRSQLTYVRGRIDSVGQNRFFVDLAPGLTFDNGTVKVHGGIRYNYFSNSVDSGGVFNLGPVIEASYMVQPDRFSIMAGYTVGMTHNHYYDMIFENRYLSPEVEIRPTTDKMHIYLGAEGNVNDQIDYAARLFYRRVQDQLIYTTSDSLYFQAVYDSLMTHAGAHVELNYDLSGNIQAGAALSVNVYNTSNQDSLTARFFHAAPVRLDLYGAYKWNNQLTARADLFVYGPTPMGLDGETGEVITRATFLDLNLSADYRITEAISVFLTVNNLFNSRYQRWLNYPERRIDFMGGLTVAF